MIRSSLVAMLAICAVCSFCGKEFVTLGRHSWRCKQKLNQNLPGNTVNQMPVIHSAVRISNTDDVKCYCGMYVNHAKEHGVLKCINVVVV